MYNAFFKEYFEYVGTNEIPMIYRRWAAIAMVAALLGRDYYLPFGHGRIYPNMYTILIGSPGARKGGAMGPVRNLLLDAGYNKFGADRTSGERFIIDLYRSSLLGEDTYETLEDIENINLDEPSELFVLADEFADFIGLRNMSFINTLTKMWDCPPKYEHPKIHGKSVFVTKPTVNIFAATTPQSLLDTVPPEAIGQGFTSRFIFVFARSNGEKVTWPSTLVDNMHKDLVEKLFHIRKDLKGAAAISTEAKKILDRMYKEFTPVDDPRFQYYNTRRFTHLLKLCLVMSAMRHSTEINTFDAIQANTILYATEKKMPLALGELGRGRFSEVTNTILELIQKKNLSFREIWKHVAHDLDKEADLSLIMRNLMSAGKIQNITIANKICFKRNMSPEAQWDSGLLDEDFLTEEELML